MTKEHREENYEKTSAEKKVQQKKKSRKLVLNKKTNELLCNLFEEN